MRRLAYTLVLAAALFLAAFAAGFFTIGRAMAQPETPSAEDKAPEDKSNIEHGMNSPTEHGEEHHAEDPTKTFRFFGPPFGHSGKDVLGGKYGDGKNENPANGEVEPGEEEPMSAPFIYMIINFAILLFIIMKFGAPAARTAARDRHDQISNALQEAAKLRQQAADKLAELETKVKDADAEVKKLVDGMRADAEADKKRILDNAERQAAQMKKDAEERIAAEIEYARAALTKEVTQAAAKATEDLLKQKMVPSDHNKLVNTFISDVGGRS